MPHHRREAGCDIFLSQASRNQRVAQVNQPPPWAQGDSIPSRSLPARFWAIGSDMFRQFRWKSSPNSLHDPTTHDLLDKPTAWTLKSHIRILLAWGVLLLVVLISVAPTARSAEITVFAAASLTDSFRKIAANYEKQSGDKVLFNFNASSILARQIAQGAPADIFFSADEAKMDDLEKRGLIQSGTRKSRLSNSLVIVVASRNGPALNGPKDLAGDHVKRIALAEPSTVPAGIYARQYLQRQGLWTAVEPKV